jgi:CheY-like chemotaxis protein
VKNGNGNGTTTETGNGLGLLGSSCRVGGAPPILPRKVWLLGLHAQRLQTAADALARVGHEARVGEPGGEVAPTLKDYKPDVIVIDMAEAPERGRHFATQLRADRATRQLPIILVGVTPEEAPKSDRTVTGPTRRYANHLDTASVLNSLICDL